jgi:UDPglucose 6-dehydrogenase
MRIVVLGLGYVGLVTATGLARLGQSVVGVDTDEAKLEALRRGDAPFYEPNLQGELTQQLADGRLEVTDDPVAALRGAEMVMICVGTPSRPSGDADLGAVDAVVEVLGQHLEPDTVVVLRSTVPVGTTRRVESVLNAAVGDRLDGAHVSVLVNPEFLRTGRALEDFLRPTRVVIGATGAPGPETDRLAALYRAFDTPVLVMDAESAELVKNAANSYLATRVSFVNELATLCEATGADVEHVISGLATDPRIGAEYLRPGLGYGGSCLPKDVQSMLAMGREHGVPLDLIAATDRVNAALPGRIVDRLATVLGSLDGARIAVLGLAFKPDTDDIRESPALRVATELNARGAEVVGCDPQAATRAGAALPWLVVADDPIAAVRGADAAVLATEWAEYVTLDLTAVAAAMRRPVLLDGRQALDAQRAIEAGLVYLGVGEPVEREGPIAERYQSQKR